MNDDAHDPCQLDSAEGKVRLSDIWKELAVMLARDIEQTGLFYSFGCRYMRFAANGFVCIHVSHRVFANSASAQKERHRQEIESILRERGDRVLARAVHPPPPHAGRRETCVFLVEAREGDSPHWLAALDSDLATIRPRAI